MHRPAAIGLVGVLVLLSSAGAAPTFGGFVGSADSTVRMSVDALDQHVTVTVPDQGGALELRNDTASPQSLAVRMVDPADGTVSASFEPSGGDHAVVAPGATATVKLADSGGNASAGKVELGVARPEGTLFPNGIYAVAAP
jgi:P pilus assembly chaperone PapD